MSGEPADALNRVRRSAAEVCHRAAHVALLREKVEDYAESLVSADLALPQLDPASHYLGEEDATLAFIVTLDTLNFGSGYFPQLRKREGRSGYFTIATALTEQFRRHGPWEARELVALLPEDCARVFDQDMGSPPVAELMGLFSRALNDLGRHLEERHEGSFRGMVYSAQGKAALLVEELARMPLFDDVAHYDGEEVAFYKRAQLTAADLSLAFAGRGPGEFHDLERLTIFADNLVPHVLRCDGVLRYDSGLARKVDEGELIPAGSAEEVEIRACAVHAVELLAGELRRQGRRTCPMQIDYLLWNRGQAKHYKAQPRHRTRTTFY